MSSEANNGPVESPMPSLVDIDELPQTPHHSMLNVLVAATEVAIESGGGEITRIIRVGTPAARQAHVNSDQENSDPLPIPSCPPTIIPPPTTVSSAINTLLFGEHRPRAEIIRAIQHICYGSPQDTYLIGYDYVGKQYLVMDS